MENCCFVDDIKLTHYLITATNGSRLKAEHFDFLSNALECSLNGCLNCMFARFSVRLVAL